MSFTEEMLKDLKRNVKSLKLIPSGGGRFEVTVDGTLVFSKLVEDRFPTYKELGNQIRKAAT